MRQIHIFLGAPKINLERYNTAGLCLDEAGGTPLWSTSKFTIESNEIPDPQPINSIVSRDSLLISNALLSNTVRIHHQQKVSPGPTGISNQHFSKDLPSDLLLDSTYKEASQRLTDIYRHVIFNDTNEPEDEFINPTQPNLLDNSEIDWEPTHPLITDHIAASAHETQESFTSFLEISKSTTGSTQASASDTTGDITHQTGSSTSIGHFPAFYFNLHKICSLQSLLQENGRKKKKERRTITLLVGVLEVDGPTRIHTRVGDEISLLKLIIGDDDGSIVKLVVWRDTADAWAEGPGVRKGDVVLFENVCVNFTLTDSPAFSASPSERPVHTICYRTLAIHPSDTRFRPDLRLGENEPSVRKVGSVVRWIQAMAGLS